MSDYFDRLDELGKEVMSVDTGKKKKEKSRKELLEEIREFIKDSKELMKITYQLAFIETSEDTSASKASEYLDELVEQGIISREMREKAHRDVQRWRRLVLDRTILLPDEYAEVDKNE